MSIKVLHGALAFGWVSLVLARPTEDQFSEDYNLTGQERRELMQG